VPFAVAGMFARRFPGVAAMTFAPVGAPYVVLKVCVAK
jgi:hypothetical protein